MVQQVLLQSSSTPSSPSQPFNNLINSFNSPSGLVMLASLGGLIVLSIMGGTKKGKLAKGRWGGTKEKEVAMRVALQQLEEKKVDPASLYIKAKQPFYIPGANRGIVVCGASSAGKTFTVIDPLLRSHVDQGNPVILYDFDYPNQTSRIVGYAARRRYKINVFAPGHSETCTCNPVDFLTKETDSLMARQFAEVLNRNLKRTSSNSEDPFFREAGDNMLVSSLMLAKSTDYPDLLTCADLLSIKDLPQRVEAHENELNEWISRGFGQLVSVSESEKTTSSIQGTAYGFLNRFMSEDLAPAFCGKTTLPLDLEGRQMIVLGIDRQKRNVLPPLVAAILEMIVNRNVARKRRTPLLLALDEVPTLYLSSLIAWITQNRKDGLITLLGFQNLAQLEQTYGKEATRTLLGSCATKFIFNPQDYESAKLFSDYIGEEEIQLKQKSQGHSSGKRNVSTTDQRQLRKLITPEEIDKLPTGKNNKCIVIVPEFASKEEAYLPIKVKLRFPNSVHKEVKDSKDLWSRCLRQEIEKRNRPKHPLNLSRRARLEAIDKKLPPLKKKVSDTIVDNVLEEAEKTSAQNIAEVA